MIERLVELLMMMQREPGIVGALDANHRERIKASLKGMTSAVTPRGWEAAMEDFLAICRESGLEGRCARYRAEHPACLRGIRPTGDQEMPRELINEMVVLTLARLPPEGPEPGK